MKQPRISIIIPVYNSAATIDEALSSLSAQTYKDFEVLVIDDHSGDNTAAVVNSLIKQDPRIKLIQNKYEKGIVGALNTGLESSNSELIARMDGDDISLPRRLEKQVDLLDHNPEVGIVGTWMKVFGDAPRESWAAFPATNDEIRFAMLFYNPFAHPTVMLRRKIIAAHNLKYHKNFEYAEDYELWVRLLKFTKGANIQQNLLKYRTHQASVSRNQTVVQLQKTAEIQRIYLQEYLAVTLADQEFSLLQKSYGGQTLTTVSEIKTLNNVILKLLKKNEEKHFIAETVLLKCLAAFYLENRTRNFKVYLIQLGFYLEYFQAVRPIALKTFLRKIKHLVVS